MIPDPGLYPLKTDSTAIFDNKDKLIRLTLNSEQSYRLFIPLSRISTDLVNATLLYEDRYYYYHPGFNPFSIIRAIKGLATDSRPVGASTISMQTARMRFNLKTRSFVGKLEQILRAIQLERHYSKDQILEAYFNLAPYGRNIEGVGAASLIYFAKKPDALTFPEALTLSVIPQNPTGRCPLSSEGYKKMDSARNDLFTRLSSLKPEYSKNKGFMDLKLACGSPETLPFRAPHFADYVLANRNHYSEEKPNNITGNMSGNIIRTTLDSEIQAEFENIITKHVKKKYFEGMRNAAAFLVDSETMSIIAMAGSADFFDSSIYGQVNAVTAKRSPGSALKPFVYALAIDQGLIHPMTLLKDTPLRYGAYAPENFDKRFQGPLSATDALNQSRNVPALSLAAKLSQPDIYDFLKLAGVSGMKEKDFYGLSPVLGGCEVSMLEMAELYAMLANGGVLRPVDFRSDHHLNNNKSGSGQRLLSPEASFLVLDMLLGNPSPYAEYSSDYEISSESEKSGIAWKTGTSWGFRDAWAAGVAGRFVLVVWVGNFKGEGNPVFVGRTAAGPIFFDMLALLEKKYGDFKNAGKHPGPSLSGLNLKKIDVCAVSGGLPNRYTPKTVKTWFMPGKSPITVSTIHRAVPVDVKTHLRACQHNPPSTKLEIFEFWPSDISRVFHEAGIFRPEPPRYMKDCGLDQRDETGQPPQIISPDSTVTYVIRNTGNGNDKIPLEATAENGVGTLYWFAGDAFIGQSVPGEMFLWEAPTGEYQILVVDDNGLAAVKKLSVKRE